MFREERQEPRFEWAMLGDIEKGRPNLGSEMPVAVYRLMQFTLRDVLIQEFDVETADRIFYKAGFEAGREFYTNVIGSPATLDDVFDGVQRALKELKIGIFRVESADEEKGSFVITVAEDLDCSGIPVCAEQICTYDEGFIEGILNAHTGRKFTVKEVDCWGCGDRVCRFTVEAA